MLEILLLITSSIIGLTPEQESRQIYSAFNGKPGVKIQQISEKEMEEKDPRAAGIYDSRKREINYLDYGEKNLWILLHEFGHDLAPHEEIKCKNWQTLEEATAYMFADWGLTFLNEINPKKAEKLKESYNEQVLTTWAYGDKIHSKGIKLYLETKGRFGKDLIGLEKGINYLCDLRKIK